jgi:cell filamentation protein
MASKYQLADSTLYYAHSEVPINKHNIQDAQTIHEIEKELLEEAYTIFFDELSESTVFDEDYFKSLHKRVFGTLYDWAGKYRDFNMSKGDSRFCQGAFVESESKKIFEKLKQDNYLKDYEEVDRTTFIKKLAYYKCELNALHPFYELNGRVTRLFVDMIVVYNGYKFVDYASATEKEYIDAAIECVQFADSTAMETILLNGLHK